MNLIAYVVVVVDNGYKNLTAMAGAESEQVVAAGASSNTSGIIISIAVSSGTSGLENPGVRSGLAGLRIPKAPSAAIPGRVESETSTFAGHHSAVGPHL